MKQKYEEEKVNKSKLEEDMSKLRDYYDSKMHDVEGKLTTSQGISLHYINTVKSKNYE